MFRIQLDTLSSPYSDDDDENFAIKSFSAVQKFDMGLKKVKNKNVFCFSLKKITFV